ncbi:CubicO group peptidase (beta-lactamase class C family) [Paenibacillus sp. JGP012]|uniref:serine hydrolase domain-containing protein n=1 Tax=Paenibacillus sp. JGP012 TaxID=2735914 RepID=UPI0016197035|nr:serine hydrolase domain-containing protein [Paenibacillus sp. JGP012]MBB6022752.1 CubicO group peptidase (beta-lactamase class C family) [Paenibacillus sp. JGP012]
MKTKINRVVKPVLTQSDNKFNRGVSECLYERMASYDTPGVSIALIDDFEIKWACGYGVKQFGINDLVTDTTRFQAGSISKPVFALAVMLLDQAGEIDIDRNVNDYLNVWKMKSNNGWQPRVTLRQLLSHSAGVTVSSFPGYLKNEKIPSTIEILMGLEPSVTESVKVDYLPGGHFRYSGGGYTIAQLVIEELMEKSFPEIMKELVLGPFGMNNSTFEQILPQATAEEVSSGHFKKKQTIKGGYHIYPEMAAAGLWTTPTDLASLGVALQSVLSSKSCGPLERNTILRMLEPQTNPRMGIGFYLEGRGKDLRFTHNGCNEGFTSRLTLYKNHGKGAVIMVNANEDGKLIFEIEKELAREYNWPGYFPREISKGISIDSHLERITGRYIVRKNVETMIQINNNQLELVFDHQPPLILIPETKNKFRISEIKSVVYVENDKQGEVVGLSIHEGDNKIFARKSKF